MAYEFPDEATLVKYLAVLRDVLVIAKNSTDPQVAELAYAVHNVPDLLARWPDMKEQEVHYLLRRWEERYINGATIFTSTLENGPGDNWQLRWGKPKT
jgi:hypothetical protein